MAPFKKSVCYYYRGKIYHSGNDPLLRRISLKGNIEGFAEDAQGNVLIEEREGLHLVLRNGSVRNINSINGSPIRECTAVCRSSNGHFLVQEGTNIWNFSNSFTFFRSISIAFYNPVFISMDASGVVVRQGHKQSYFEDFVTGRRTYMPSNSLHYVHISFSLLNDGSIYINEFWGATQIDSKSGNRRLFLPGVQVSRTFRDKDGNLWFTTMNHGIYRLNSEEFRTKTFGSEADQSVSTMTRLGDTIWVGTDHNQIFKLAMPDLRVVHTAFTLPEAKGRVLLIDTCGKGIIYCSGYGVLFANRQLIFKGNDGIPIKWVLRMNPDTLLIGNASGVMIYSIWASWITDTLSRERSTAGLIVGNDIYFGTMSGLYKVNPDRSVVFLGQKIPFLTKRISCMAATADGTLWIASYDDAGIIGIRGDTVVAAITKKQGLTSDICRALLIKGGVLWVGTDKGLNAIRLDRPGYPITRYTAKDGLASDMINMLYADDSVMYVSSPAGLSFFNVNKAQAVEPCRLRLLELMNSGRDRIDDTANLSLSYHAKDIHFEFVGISYRSSGDIRYRYRVLGLDSNWRETNQTFLDYPSLPSGGYVFQLQATNKFGLQSRMLSLPFRVETPYWDAIWFRGLVIAVIVLLTWMWVSWRIRYIRRQQNEKEQLIKQRAEMENTALLAQMNPHFIFNCLNSIQQFVFDKDMMATNEYISNFARLIRATLNHSSRPFISVTEEVEYLTDYLSLEKMRFKNKMDYFVEVAPGLDADDLLLPPLLLHAVCRKLCSARPQA